MPVPTIESSASIAFLLEENTFTVARLSTYAATAPLGADFEAFASAVATLLVGDESLDRVVDAIERTLLLTADGDRAHPAYQRYFGAASRREIERPILG